MTEPATETSPPDLRRTPDGRIDNSSLADVIEWFLNYDERVARIRHTNTDALFRWKQQDDETNGVGTYPFENAEARFAIGVVQAVAQNDSEPLLKLWITDVLAALSHGRETKNELATAYGLDDDLELPSLEKAAKLTTNNERRLYLSSCWLEALCTAEARVLGWMYHQIYGRPFTP